MSERAGAGAGAPTLADIFGAFLRVGATAYGGPAMMPLMRGRILARGWLSEEGFKVGLAMCQAIPGGTLMQMAAYTGLIQRGLFGALAGFVGFGLPAFALITGLSVLYHATRGLSLAASAMQGLSAVVMGIIFLAVWDFGLKYARGLRRVAMTLAAGGLFLYGLAPAWIILGAALVGPVVFRGETAPPVSLPESPVPWRGVLALAAVAAGWLALSRVFWPVLFDISVSMARADLVAFGGFGVFPALYHEAVDVRAYMNAATFLDGMALAQVTPGPFMLGACFIGYHAAGLPGALAAGIWIFTPSFFLLMLAVPWANRLLAWQPFRRALAGVLSTLGGLILSVGAQLAWGMGWSLPKAAMCLAATFALWRGAPPVAVVLAGVGLGLWLL